MAKRLCLDPTAGASSDSSSGSAGASSGSAGASSSFDSASASSSASSSGDYTLVCQCGYVTSVPHPLTCHFNFLGKTLHGMDKLVYVLFGTQTLDVRWIIIRYLRCEH